MVHSISAFEFLMPQKCLVKPNSTGRQKWEASRNLHACCIVAPNLLVLIFWDAQLTASRSHPELLCVVIFMVTRLSDDQASWQLNIYPWKHPGSCIETKVGFGHLTTISSQQLFGEMLLPRRHTWHHSCTEQPWWVPQPEHKLTGLLCLIKVSL